MALKIPETISEKEFLEILKHTKNKNHKLAFALAFYNCLRISEIVGLKKQVSKCCGSEIIKIRHKGKRQSLICSNCKKELTMNDIKRHQTEWDIFPLTKENVDYGRKLLLIKQAKGKKDRHIPIAPEMIRGLKNLPVNRGVRALEIAFKKEAMKILKKDLHFHCLRHSGATHYLNVKKWDVRYVQQFLGHSNINTTTIYTHVNPQNLVEKMWD